LTDSALDGLEKRLTMQRTVSEQQTTITTQQTTIADLKEAVDNLNNSVNTLTNSAQIESQKRAKQKIKIKSQQATIQLILKKLNIPDLDADE